MCFGHTKQEKCDWSQGNTEEQVAVESQFYGVPQGSRGRMVESRNRGGPGKGPKFILTCGEPGFVPSTWYTLLILTTTLPRQCSIIPTLQTRKPRLGELLEFKSISQSIFWGWPQSQTCQAPSPSHFCLSVAGFLSSPCTRVPWCHGASLISARGRDG